MNDSRSLAKSANAENKKSEPGCHEGIGQANLQEHGTTAPFRAAGSCQNSRMPLFLAPVSLFQLVQLPPQGLAILGAQALGVDQLRQKRSQRAAAKSVGHDTQAHADQGVA